MTNETTAHPDAWMLTDDGKRLQEEWTKSPPHLHHSAFLATLRDRIVAACEARMAATVREKERAAFKAGWGISPATYFSPALMRAERDRLYPLPRPAYPSRTMEDGRVFRQVGPDAFGFVGCAHETRAYWSRRDIPWTRDEFAAIDAVLAEEVK